MKILAPKKESATTLVVVITVMAVLVVAVATAVEYTSTIGRHVQRSVNLQNAIAIGDGALESAFSYWRELCRVNTKMVIPNSWTALIPLPTGGSPNTQFPNIANFSATTSPWTSATTATISNFKVVAADAELNPLTASGDVPVPSVGMANNGAVDMDTTHAVYNWIATAYVTLPTLRGNVVAKVQRIFQKEQISPWNYAIFYVDPLEIHPGPDFWVTGPVSTNTELYTAHNTLHFLDKVSYGTDWSIGYHPLDLYHQPPNTSPTWATGLPPARDIAHQPFGLDATRIFSTTNGNPNDDSYHELIEPPVSGYDDPLVGQRYFDQAGAPTTSVPLPSGMLSGIQVTISSNNTISYSRGDGNGGSIPLTSSSSGTDKKLYDMVNGAITVKNGTNDVYMQDAREGAQVRIATLDLSKIRKAKNDGWKGDAPFNGVLYLRDSSGTSTTHRGFRLVNGDYIPAGGLTIASPNPVYIQGDYNTGNNPPSNVNTPTDPEGDMSGAGGSASTPYARQPCSVIADAVNILSNSFTDSQLSGSSRVASNTTVNTAIVSGIVPTTNASYSGGAENFPRFHENWSTNGAKLTYYGSMVELYNSTQSIGKWSNASYVPPIRQWYFDTNFKFSCPPGSLMIYSYVKGRWSLAP